MPINAAPYAAEVIGEDTVFPVSVHIVIGTKKQHDIVFFIKIVQRKADARQNAVGFRPQGEMGNTVLIHLQRHTVPTHSGQALYLRQLLVVHAGDILHPVVIQLAGQFVGVEIFERLAGADIGVAIQIVQVAIVGIVAGKAGGFGAVGPADPIQHTVLQGIQHISGGLQQAGALPGHVAQIHHVGVALLTGVAAVVFALCGNAGKPGEEPGILAGSGQRFSAKGLIGLQQRAGAGQVG